MVDAIYPALPIAALNYLTFLHGFFAGNWLYSIAAYDGGEGSIQNAVRKNMREHKSTDFWMLRIPHETQIYVPRLLALAEIISNPQKYGIELPTVSTRAYLVKVDLDSQIEIKQAAQLAGMKASELANLNPGHQRWAQPHPMVLIICYCLLIRPSISKQSSLHCHKKREYLGSITRKSRRFHQQNCCVLPY